MCEGGMSLKAQNERKRVLKKLAALAFDTPNDAVKLAFFDEEKGVPASLRGLDLTMLAGVKRSSNGSIELKLVDRIALMKLLLDELKRDGQSAADAFLQAMSRDDDDDGEDGGDDDGSDEDGGDERSEWSEDP